MLEKRTRPLTDGQPAESGPEVPSEQAASTPQRDAVVKVVVRPGFGARARAWLGRQDWTVWALVAIALLALIPRLYGLNWDANNQLHPDEREIILRASCLSLPGTPRDPSCGVAFTGPGWFFSPQSPLNPHFFAYGSLPQYLVAGVAHGLAWLTRATGGRFLPPDRGAWDDFNHFTLVGRALSALFDAGSVLLAGLIARRLAGHWAGLLAAAFAAVIPFDVQVAHFYAVDTPLLFFVLLTLLACLALARGREPRQVVIEDEDFSITAGSGETRRAWGAGVFVGVAFGLAMATKVSALPLLAPIGAALLLRGARRGFDQAFFGLLGVAAAALLTFAVVSPYALIDSTEFLRQVAEQTDLSQGKLDYPYVRQFSGSTPYLYQIGQLLLFDMALPLGLLGLAGFAWAVTRVWRSWRDDWLVIVVFVAGYFAVVGGAYMKFTRYMLPVFALLAVCGAAALAALASWGARRLAGAGAGAGARERVSSGAVGVGGWRGLLRRDPFGWMVARRLTALYGPRWWRAGCAALGVMVLAATLFFTLALLHIYSQPNTRVQASEWLFDHVPAGSTVTYEIWDRPLPIDVPAARTGSDGQPLTAAGNPIIPGEYQQLGLDIYAADTPEKAAQLAQQLATADVVVLSSNHLLHSIPRIPDRYPMSTRYYQLLFGGQLGFRLAAHIDRQPSVFGVTINDTGADESWSFYDHPPVWIFTRSGAALGAERIRALLTDGLYLPAESTRAGSQKPLLLPAANAQANASSPALASQFPADSLPNQIPLIWWLLAVEALGLVVFPLAFVVFPGLRDRGWGMSKLLGLLTLGLAAWLPASLRLLPFDRWFVIAAFAALAIVGGLVGWRLRAALRAYFREHWRLVVACEALFVVGFLAFAWIRALDPDLWHIWRGGEKPMEFAYLNAILRSRYMPPYDPFFSGGYINYYYYGQYLVAVLIKLTGIAPATAFNLAIPLFFGVTLTGAFSVVAGLTGRWWAGVAGAVGLGLVGNFDGAAQAFGQWQAKLQGGIIPAFDFWRSSRVIPYTINEFPFWSFLYADLHAHLLDLPVVVVVVGCCASLLGSAKGDGGRWRPAAPTLAAVAVALGATWCINTWDVPLGVILVALALALRLLPQGAGTTWADLRARLTWPALRSYGVALALTLGAAYALYLPFHIWFYNFLSGGTGQVTTPTPPNLFLTIFGLWLFLTATFFLAELRARLDADRPLPTLDAGANHRRLWLVAGGGGVALVLTMLLSVKLGLIVLLGLGLYLALNPRNSTVKLMAYALLLVGLAITLGVELIYVRDFLDSPPWNRMNTVFKFYYQAWILLALGGALVFALLIRPMLANDSSAPPEAEQFAGDETSTEGKAWRALRAARDRYDLSRVALKTAWVVALTALVLASSIFLVEGTQVRVQDPVVWAQVQPPPGGLQPQGLSLDGTAFMRGWYPSDYDAITWMNAHIAGTPTIIEASYGTYNWQGRVAVYTGLPAVVDQSHEDEQRFPYEVGRRQQAVETFWGTEDPNAALDILREYNVRYVYVGELERTCYVKYYDVQRQADICQPMTGAALGKFDALQRVGVLQSVYRTASVTIYKVTG